MIRSTTRMAALALLVFSVWGADTFAQSTGAEALAFEEALGEGPVYIIPVEGMIDNALATYIERALDDATSSDAALVILDIDTFGGLVDAADRIRKTLLDSPIPIVSFIDKNAASAGALIAYATDRIVMVPGSSIGAATVVEGMGGEAAPDKYQSYMRGQIRATAEATGRDPRIAEAMVDESIAIEGITEEGKVLTLSSGEALDLGVADAVLKSKDEVIAALGLTETTRVAHQASVPEQILRFFASPVLQSILMLMMMGGLYFELQTPGVGFPGIIAVLGAAFFFAPHYLLGLVESWEIILFGIGVVLIMAEIFIIPGFGVAGISGLVLVVGSLVAALVGNVGLDFPDMREMGSALSTMAVTLVLFVALLFSLGRYLPKAERFNQLVLQPELSSTAGYIAATSADNLLGLEGRAATDLRPSGMAVLDGKRVDVVTQGEYIEQGTTVYVTKVNGSRVEVRAVAS